MAKAKKTVEEEIAVDVTKPPPEEKLGVKSAVKTAVVEVAKAAPVDVSAKLFRYIEFLHANYPNKLVTLEQWDAKTNG